MPVPDASVGPAAYSLLLYSDGVLHQLNQKKEAHGQSIIQTETMYAAPAANATTTSTQRRHSTTEHGTTRATTCRLSSIGGNHALCQHTKPQNSTADLSATLATNCKQQLQLLANITTNSSQHPKPLCNNQTRPRPQRIPQTATQQRRLHKVPPPLGTRQTSSCGRTTNRCC